MEWIKAKYDRLLLGLFGIIALVVGGFLVMKVLGFKSTHFKARPDPVERNQFGTDTSGKKLEAAKALLAQEAKVNPPRTNNLPISLFASFPVLKHADNRLINVLDPNSEQLRPPVANDWLYKNDLDITRSDIADLDSDGDGYTNAEEFIAKTLPRDKDSTPPFTGKIAFTELVQDPFTLNFTIDGGDQEITIRRSEPANLAFNSLIPVGGEFPATKGAAEMRFKLTKVIREPGMKPVAVLDDLSTKDKVDTIELVQKVPKAMPGLRAKLVCGLGAPEEMVVTEAEEFSFAANPEFKFTVLKITAEEVTLEFTPSGETEKKTVTYKLPPPP